jgi:hypothetical protein
MAERRFFSVEAVTSALDKGRQLAEMRFEPPKGAPGEDTTLSEVRSGIAEAELRGAMGVLSLVRDLLELGHE